MASRTQRIIQVGLAFAIAIPVGLALRLVYRHFRGIEVCVRNVDVQPLRAGEVAVNSSTAKKLYKIGDLSPTASACVWVKAEGEANVVVTFTTPTGASKVMPLNGYIEQGYSGWITADVTSDGARNIKDHIDFF